VLYGVSYIYVKQLATMDFSLLNHCICLRIRKGFPNHSLIITVLV
jgi:hypothetical protein